MDIKASERNEWMRASRTAMLAFGVFFVGLGCPGELAAQTPIDLTGWNHDVVYENDGSPFISAPVDANGISFGENGLFVTPTYKWNPSLNNGNGAYETVTAAIVGLPANHNIASIATNTITGSHTSFTLQNYSANNAALMTGVASVTLQLSTPQRMSSLALLNASTNGDSTQPVQVTLHFENDPTPVSFTFSSKDWKQEVPYPVPEPLPPVSADTAIDRMDRVFGSSTPGSVILEQRKFVLYETDINLTSLGFDSKAIQSITFQKVTSNLAYYHTSAVFAVSGSALGNRSDFFQGSNLLEAANYQLAANSAIHRLPTANSDDVVLATGSGQTLTIDNGNLTMGSLNLLTGSNHTLQNGAVGTSNLTLGTSSNSISASRDDLIYLGPGAGNLTLVGENGGGVLNISLTRTGNLNVADPNATLAISSAISGSGFGINKTGSGVVALSGLNTFSGTTTVDGGRLEAAANGTLGGTGNIIVNAGGTLLLTGADVDRVSDTAPISIASGGKLQFGNAATDGSETLGALTLSSGGILDFGPSLGDFEALFVSLQLPESGYATILNWNGSILQGFGADTDRLLFTAIPGGTSTDALRFDIGGTLHSARFIQLGNSGVYEALPNQTLAAVPEPTTLFAGLVLLGLYASARRNRSLNPNRIY